MITLSLCIILMLPEVGVDLLALMHNRFPVRTVSRSISYPVAVGLLDNTFSTNTKNVEYLLKRDKITSLRVHIYNGSCLRYKRCERHTQNCDIQYNLYNCERHNNCPEECK